VIAARRKAPLSTAPAQRPLEWWARPRRGRRV